MRMRAKLPIIVGFFLLLAVLCPAEELIHTSESGVEFKVTEEGLSSISVKGKQVASGGWYAWNAGPYWFAQGNKNDVLAYGYYSRELTAKVAKGVTQKSFERISEIHARVRHVQPDAIATYDYVFSGEDVTIRVRLENNHPTSTLKVPAFGGLRFSFAAEPKGIVHIWHTSYLQKVQSGAFHPSHLNKIGGSYACDDSYGVGLSPVFRGLERTLFMWDYDKWNPDANAKANRWLSYLRWDPIPPGGALTFAMTMRVSPNTEWQHLLQPYKDQFLKAFGKKTYNADFRCVAVAHLNRNKEAIGPKNPYGFHGGFRRIDQPEGVKKLCDLIIPGLKKANGQGLIIWGQGGQEPRGEMYRADFDILPPEVAENWQTMMKRFKEAGLKLGVTARPRHMHIRLDWENDGTIDINPDDPQHLKLLGDRFQHMVEKGCTLYYLDSFGSSYDDVKTMRYLRKRLGPTVETFAEHSCDVMAVYSAFYSETDFWAKGSAKWAEKDQWRPRIGLQFLDIVRWMLGPVPCISRAYDTHGKIPEGFESSTEYFYKHDMSPMLEDYKLPQTAEGVRKIQDQYVDKNDEPKDQ